MVRACFIDLDRRDTEPAQRDAGQHLIETIPRELILNERWLPAGTESREHARIWLHDEFARKWVDLGASEIAIVALGDKAHLFVHMRRKTNQ